MYTPTISVLIPCYNAERTIQETISSVLAQTFTDFELLVINDGSTDGTMSVLEQITDDRLKVVSFENSGPQKSRNRGIEKARGKYITFIDADDLWTSDKLASQLQALQNTPEAAVAYSWTDFIDENSNFLKHSRHIEMAGDVYEQLLIDDFIASGSNPLIKAEAIRAVGGFDENTLAGQDWDMWLMLAEKFQFVAVPKVQILYRKSCSSKTWSDNIRRQAKGHIQVMNKHLSNRKNLILKKSIYFAGRYRYLLFHCLDQGRLTPDNGVLALRFFAQALVLEPGWWTKRPQLILLIPIKSLKYLFAYFLGKQKAVL